MYQTMPAYTTDNTAERGIHSVKKILFVCHSRIC